MPRFPVSVSFASPLPSRDGDEWVDVVGAIAGDRPRVLAVPEVQVDEAGALLGYTVVLEAESLEAVGRIGVRVADDVAEALGVTVAGVELGQAPEGAGDADEWGRLDAELMADPSTRQAWERIRPRYERARRMIALRSDAGLSQAELAERAGLSLDAIAELESGDREPEPELLARIVRAVAGQASPR